MFMCASKIALAHTRMKRLAFAFESIGRLDPVRSSARGRRRDVEIQREIRLQIGVHPLLEELDLAPVDAATSALIREGCIREAIAQHPRAGIERRPDHLPDVFASRCEDEQCLRFGVEAFLA
jgi:hypothetical protein